MNTSPLSDLLGPIHYQCQGLNEDTLLDLIRLTAIDFCKRSGVSQETIEVDVDAGENQINISPPNSYVVPYRIISATGPNGPLKLCSLGSMNSVPRWRTQTSVPNTVIQESNTTLTLFPAPQAAFGPLYLFTRFIPKNNATKLDSILVGEWASALIDGTLARVLSNSNQTWSDPAQAERRQATYEHRIAEAMLSANKNNSAADVRPNMPKWF